MGTTPTPTPAVGLATKVGLGVSGTAFTTALAAFVLGDRSEQTLGVLVSGAIGALSLAVTLLGRYWQAASVTKRQSSPLSSATTCIPGGTTNYTMVSSTGNPTIPVSSFALRTGPQTPTTADQIDPEREVPGGGVPAGTSEQEAMRALGRKA